MIPDDIRQAVRAAADDIAPYSGDPEGVRLRGRARRTRAITMTAAVAAVALTVIATFGALRTTAPTAATGSTQVPAQRLYVGGSFGLSGSGDALDDTDGLSAREIYEKFKDSREISGVVSEPSEILANGKVVKLTFDTPKGVEGPEQPLLRPGGGYVGTGRTRPKKSPCHEGVENNLVIGNADGSTRADDVREARCDFPVAVGVDAKTAFVLIGRKLVAYDLATGATRTLLKDIKLGDLELYATAYANGRYVDIAGSMRRRTSVRVRVIDTRTGKTSNYPVTGLSPSGGAQLRLSPDGSYAALDVRGESQGKSAMTIKVIDLATGKVVASKFLNEIEQMLGKAGHNLDGMAWHDNHTLRVAWSKIPAKGVAWLPNVVRTETVTVK